MKRGLIFGTLLSLVACGAPPSDGPKTDEPPLGLSDTALRFKLAKYAVQPGDSFECHFTEVTTDRELFVNRASGKQGNGGHHVTIYYKDGAPSPPGHHTCKEEEMTQWNQVGGAGNEGEGVADLPPNVAIRIPKGKQMVVQTHYINPTSEPYEVEDEITVNLVPEKDVQRVANAFVVLDSGFEIPPQAKKFERTTTCVVPQDLDLVVLLGHMHESGAHYKLERLDESGKVVESLVDHGWEPSYASHPPSKHWSTTEPHRLAKGTKLRQTCAWNNVENEAVRFPREMCLAFSYYLDDRGFIICNGKEE